MNSLVVGFLAYYVAGEGVVKESDRKWAFDECDTLLVQQSRGAELKKHRIIRTQGQRIALQNTSRIPDKEWIEAIKFVAKEINLDKVVIHAKKSGPYSRRAGRAYYYIPSMANMNGLKYSEWHHLVIVSDEFKTSVTRYVMDTLGHEAKHIEQFKRGTLRREKKARNCEPQARAFGAWIADQWVAQTC